MRAKDDEKVCRVHRAALKLFNEQGFHGASMGKIAKEAGVSPATLYLYYENKDDMIRKVYLQENARMAEAVLGKMSGESFRQRLRSIFMAYYHYILESPQSFRFMEQYLNCPCLSGNCVKAMQDSFAELFKLLRAGKRDGLLRNVSDDMLFAFLFFPVGKVAKATLTKAMSPTADDLEDMFDMSWSAVRA
ncbi:AcrR family transcriptional regulator [Fulvitalea axinellae]|uniref:AcrR family transcriptional regulator n=1 Tax=Fulvitalea axinellae TaxID=1182444 RepID=A0AAU9CRH3_9BACT|nr:AcrR family transcriptional regulator [Fulvitalea axinellae]